MQHKINYQINNIRAFAIIAVVFGHSIIIYSLSWGIYKTENVCQILDAVKRYIDLFQMPLFFSLSGYLFTISSKKETILEFCKKKFRRLMLPFFLIGAIWMIPVKLILGYPGYQADNYVTAFLKLLMNIDSGHLWFLPTLFIMFIVFIFVKKIVGSKSKIISLLVCLGIGCIYWFWPDFRVPYLRKFYQYAWAFLLGACMTEKVMEKVLLFLRKSKWINVIIFIVCLIDTVILSRNDLVCAVLFIVSIYSLASDRSNAMLNKISKNSFGIYLFHSPLIYITFTFFLNYPIWFVVLLNFVVWGGVAYFMTELVRRINFKILIGEW